MIGVGGDPVRVSWAIDGSVGIQLSAEIQTSGDQMFQTIDAVATHVGSEQVAIVAPGDALRSREVRYARVRACVDGTWTSWSEPCGIEIGLLDAHDWIGVPITLPGDPGRVGPAPSPLLRTTFEVRGVPVDRARLYATAWGVYRLHLNGDDVSSDLLAPGWTTYHRRLLAQTYDVGHLLVPGANCLAGTLGDGWFRGRIGWSGTDDRCRYGDQVALLAQLEIRYQDGIVQTVATDSDWKAATGSIRSADLYDGCTVDRRRARPGWTTTRFDDGPWSPVAVVDRDTTVIEPWSTPPVRPIARLGVQTESIVRDGAQITRVDVGQNISGFLSIEVRGRAGDEIIVEHAEVVEADGSLHRRALRTAAARNRFILADDQPVRLEPAFTFHGFRHAEIRSAATILAVEAVAISCDLPRRSTFGCSDPRLEQLASNVMWSLRDNFVSIPTDCPQRDERMGWTGDAQAFARTASALVDARQFWASWLRDLALDQRSEGVPSVVPDVVLAGESSIGRAGWADAATIVPWACFGAYGDLAVLRDQLPSMLAWVATLRKKRHRSGPLRGLIGGEFQFGDWLDPDAPSDQPWKAKVEGDFLANAFFAHSARLTGRAARLLGDEAMADEYMMLGNEIADLAWLRWSEHAMRSQTGCATAVMLDIAADAERPAVARRLADLVLDADGAVSTGVIGTPLVLPALARYGHFGPAYAMLLRTASPSWLYQVEMGATTTWERWDAIRPDGSIHDGAILAHDPEDDPGDDHHMLSFNHYAYGAVLSWVRRHLGGLDVVSKRPGAVEVTFAPQPCRGIEWADASLESDLGHISIRWRLTDAVLVADVVVPFGADAEFCAPVTASSTMEVDGRHADGASAMLPPGEHHIVVCDPLVHLFPITTSTLTLTATEES